MEKITNEQYARTLRVLADFYELNSEMPQVYLTAYLNSSKEFIAAMKLLSKLGKVTKDMGDKSSPTYASVTASVDILGVKFSVSTSKSNVCKQVITWECPDSLLEMAMNEEEV